MGIFALAAEKLTQPRSGVAHYHDDPAAFVTRLPPLAGGESPLAASRRSLTV